MKVADKATAAEQKQILRQRAEALLAPVQDTQSPLQALGTNDLESIEQVAKECAHIDQRVRNCVEGRNGQLALRHHSWLKSVTVS